MLGNCSRRVDYYCFRSSLSDVVVFVVALVVSPNVICHFPGLGGASTGSKKGAQLLFGHSFLVKTFSDANWSIFSATGFLHFSAITTASDLLIPERYILLSFRKSMTPETISRNAPRPNIPTLASKVSKCAKDVP